MAVDLTQFLTGGAAARADSLTGLQPEFQSALQAMFAAAPPDIQAQMRIGSAYRSVDTQAKLWDDALKKYGSAEAARKWVAPPGNSEHNRGSAGDLNFLNDAAREWAHQNAAQFNLAFPLGHEPWHVELATARGGAPAASASPPVAFGDYVAPKPAPAPPALGDYVATYLRSRQDRADAEAAARARRQALFG